MITELPKQWKIKYNKNDNFIDWLNNNSQTTCKSYQNYSNWDYVVFPILIGSHLFNKDERGVNNYTEITLQEFEKFVLNKEKNN